MRRVLQHCLPNGVIQKAIAAIKDWAPDLVVISDLCFCEYTDHGHCGIIASHQGGEVIVDNDATLDLLAEQAVSHAQSGGGCHCSQRHDGWHGACYSRRFRSTMVLTILPILSYAVKYASAFYGPFREAAGSGAPQFGGRQTYQMDPANARKRHKRSRNGCIGRRRYVNGKTGAYLFRHDFSNQTTISLHTIRAHIM